MTRALHEPRQKESLLRLEATLAEGSERLVHGQGDYRADARCDDWHESVWTRDTSGKEERRSLHRHGCGLRVWNQGGTGFVVQEGAIDWRRALDQARCLARIGSAPKRRVRKPPPAPGYRPEHPEPTDSDSLQEHVELVADLLARAMREIPGALHGRVRAQERRGWRGVVTGEGTVAIRALDAAQVSLTLRVAAGDGTHVLPLTAAGRSLDAALERMDALVIETCEDLADSPTWKPLQPGRWPVVLSPRMSAALMHEAIGHPSEADRAPLDRLDRLPLGIQLGPAELQVVDRADVPDACGSMPFDDEGTPCRAAPLIQDGRWIGLLHSRQTAHVLGVEPSGNARVTSFHHPPLCRMRVLEISPGSASLSDLLGSVRKGYYLDLPGLGQLRGSGLTIHAARVWYLEHARKIHPVAGATLAASSLTVLRSITSVGACAKSASSLPWCTRHNQENLPVAHLAPSLLLVESKLV